MRRVSLLVALLVALAAVAAGCGSSGSSSSSTEAEATTSEETSSSASTYTVGWMLLDGSQEFFVEQEKAMAATFPEYGGNAVFIDAKNDPTRQLQLTQNWLNANQVQAIAGSVVDVNAFQPVLDEAAEKEVPVVLLGYEPKELQTGQSVITQDFKKWGVLTGEAMSKCLTEKFEGKGEVAVLTGPNLPGPVVNDRISGFKEALASGTPEAEIVAEVPSEGERLKGLQQMQTILQAHPNVVGVYSVTSDSQLGVLQAYKGAGKDPSELCVVGVGSGVKEAEEAFENGELYSEVDIGLEKLYGLTAEAVQALVANPKDPKYNEKVVVTDTFKPLYH